MDPRHAENMGYIENMERMPSWEAVYRDAGIARIGITFGEFIESPWEYLREAGQESAIASMARGHKPLLPKQAEVARRLQDDEVTVANKGWTPKNRRRVH